MSLKIIDSNRLAASSITIAYSRPVRGAGYYASTALHRIRQFRLLGPQIKEGLCLV
jgi:hypothetical protein